MPGEKSETQHTEQVRQPWSETLPALRSIIGSIGSMAGNIGLSPTESSALDALTANAQRGNPYAPQIGALAGDLLRGGDDRSGLVTDAYRNLQAQLGPTAAGNYLDPSKNPWFSQVTQTIGNDVTNRLAGMYAGAGRDPAGAGNFAQGLGRGIAEAVAPVFSDAYNRERTNQLNAINALSTAGNTTAGLLSNLDQLALQNRQAGVNAANAALAAENQGANQLLEIEARRRGIPLSTLTSLAGLLTPIANLGGSSSGTTTVESSSFNPASYLSLFTSGGPFAGLAGSLGSALGSGLTGLGSGLGSLASGLGSGLGSAFSAGLPLLFSDARLKDNVAPIGVLFDGTPVYSFNYVGDRTPRMGLIAQDVERRRPDAVANVRGVKAVDYGKATQRARRIGGLLDKLAYR